MSIIVDLKLGGTLKFVEDKQGFALVTVYYEQFTLTARGDEMAYTLPNDKQVQVKIAYVDSKGNPAEIEGDVTWESSDEDILEVVADSSDDMLAAVKPVGALGQAQVTARADADLGEGVREIITTMDVEVVAGEAVAGTITPVGEPTPIATPKAKR